MRRAAQAPQPHLGSEFRPLSAKSNNKTYNNANNNTKYNDSSSNNSNNNTNITRRPGLALEMQKCITLPGCSTASALFCTLGARLCYSRIFCMHTTTFNKKVVNMFVFVCIYIHIHIGFYLYLHHVHVSFLFTGSRILRCVHSSTYISASQLA